MDGVIHSIDHVVGYVLILLGYLHVVLKSIRNHLILCLVILISLQFEFEFSELYPLVEVSLAEPGLVSGRLNQCHDQIAQDYEESECCEVLV